MKVLIIGSGGREHALSWKCIQSSMVSKVYVAPGNAGTQIEDNIQNVAINPENFAELSNFAQDNEIELTIVGPEQNLWPHQGCRSTRRIEELYKRFFKET